MSQTDINQIDILISDKKDEIKRLETLKQEFQDGLDEESSGVSDSPASVAQDADADAESRAAAATAVTGQDAANVNTEQSIDSPSTAGEDFEISAETVSQQDVSVEAVDSEVVGESTDSGTTEETADESDSKDDSKDEEPKKTSKKGSKKKN